MRHSVRRQWRQWQDIGASDQVLRSIQEDVRIPFKHNRPPPNSHNGPIMQGATLAQLAFLEGELARFVESGVIDLRVFNSYCVRKRLKMETLLGVRHLTKKGDYMFSFDLQDGLYALGIAAVDRDYFTMDVRGQLYMLAGLPMGWNLSPYYFVTLTQTSWTGSPGMPPGPRSAKWLPVRELQSLARKVHYLFLAIPAARFFLRELHSVVGDRWGGRVRMTPQLRRDLQWWTSVPSPSNGKPIHRPMETTAYLHTDSSGYVWGGVLNGRLDAREFWSSADERQYITWKELKATKLKQTGAAATVIAPRWKGKAWHQALTEMAVEELTVAPRAGFIRPGRRDGRALLASAVNNFFKDHGRESMALGDLVSNVHKGLAASQVTLHPEMMRAPLPKIKYFGGWAMESSVVLDYIDPTVMPYPAAWHLFGWITP
eukprot:jgi/Tetstr1/428988/TSEL_018963.t1